MTTSDAWPDFLRTIAGSLIGVVVGGLLTFLVQYQLQERQADRESGRVAYERRLDAYAGGLEAARDVLSALHDGLNAAAPTATATERDAAAERLQAALEAMTRAEATISLIGSPDAASETKDVTVAALSAVLPLNDEDFGDVESIQERISVIQRRTSLEAEEMTHALSRDLASLLG